MENKIQNQSPKVVFDGLLNNKKNTVYIKFKSKITVREISEIKI